MTTIRIPGAGAPFDICWDTLGIPHVYAASIEDAYRGMGFCAGYERLWQIHLSTLYANGEAASVLGPRFVAQDVLHRAFDVPGKRVGVPDSPGDPVVDAYLEGLNAYVDTLVDVPPEFSHAGTEPRFFTRADVAARYRFTCWFQHRTWIEKLYLGRLMATHGVAWWRNHVRRLSDPDVALVDALQEPLAQLDPHAALLLYPDAPVQISGSNNWAIQSHLSASGAPMLAMDPHQQHSIPNTFFYAHLSAPGWDVFGAAFPGVPYFMMGYTNRIAWGLTTGFVDNYDVYIERLSAGGSDAYDTADGSRAFEHRREIVDVKGAPAVEAGIVSSHHGPVLESLMAAVGRSGEPTGDYRTTVRWELGHHASSGGALARLPLANNAAEFGDALFEGDVCPLVNNIICVDRDDDLRRFIAATIPHRVGYTGTVPLAGWRSDCEFGTSRAADLLVEHNPRSGFALTANNDTMGEQGAYPIHNFPANSARADRIRELLEVQGDGFTPRDFARMQLDLIDERARAELPDLITLLDDDDPDVELTRALLEEWDGIADLDARGACVYYPLLDRHWHVEFMTRVLDDPLLASIPTAAIGLGRWRVADFLRPGSPWTEHRDVLKQALADTARELIADLRQELGPDPDDWHYGALHQVQFWHSLRRHETWQSMQVGPDPIGGSATTLGMAMHLGPGPGRTTDGQVPLRVYHGPAYRLIVDLAHPQKCRFVIAGGNSGRPGSDHTVDHYQSWLNGRYFDLTLDRAELDTETTWSISS